jgi:hypothetical protein
MPVCYVAPNCFARSAALRLGKTALGMPSAVLLVTACQLALWASPSPVEMTPSLPPGTILPVRLDGTLDINSLHPQDRIETRVGQEVPLPNKEKISLRSRVFATVTAVNKRDDGTVSVSLKFDQLEEKNQRVAIITSLRAIASYQAVRNAQISLTGADAGTPTGWATTVQIGGDIRFGDGGKVRNRQKQTVGKGVMGGVLLHLAANAAAGCEGADPANNRLQATWVFSADACGVYDLKNVKIARDGKSDPIGVVTLEFVKEDMKLESGAGLLLRTVRQQ